MGLNYFLVNQQNKSVFCVGKGIFPFAIFQFKTTKSIHFTEVSEEDRFPFPEDVYLINSRGLLAQAINDVAKDFNAQFDNDYLELVTKRIWEFCGKKPVAWMTDDSDLLGLLKEKHGYQETGSVYVENFKL